LIHKPSDFLFYLLPPLFVQAPPGHRCTGGNICVEKLLKLKENLC